MISSNQNRSARFANGEPQSQATNGQAQPQTHGLHFNYHSMQIRNRSMSGSGPTPLPNNQPLRNADVSALSQKARSRTRSRSPGSFSGGNTGVGGARDDRSRSNSINRVENLRIKERELQLDHQMRQNRRQTAYDNLIQQIYDANSSQSFMKNQAIRSIASSSTDPQNVHFQTIQPNNYNTMP